MRGEARMKGKQEGEWGKDKRKARMRV